TDKAEAPKDTGQIPWYWIRPTKALSAAPGMHRFVWDLHYTPAPGTRTSYPIAAIAFNTPPSPTSPWVMPGTYTVKLTIDGKSMTQPLVVKMDPRVKTPVEGLQQQFTLSKQMYDGIVAANGALEQLRAIRSRIKGTPLDEKAAALEGEPAGDFGPPPRAAGQAESLNSIMGSLRTVMGLLQQADVTPSSQVTAAAADRAAALASVMKQWSDFQTEEKAMR
ncbi:MAG TPA: hypothetical protein VII12_14665, partial [Thermoanaerobaculia bacterium]